MVATQGRPIAMASPSTLGNPSVRECRQKMSMAFRQAGTSRRSPRSTKRSAWPVSAMIFISQALSGSRPSPIIMNFRL
ncbi:hypothetical protein D3C78_1610560 [compost metagenome]